MKIGIQRKILLLFTVASVAILVIVGALFSFIIRHDKFESIYGQMNEQLSLINFALTTSFEAYEEDLQSLARNSIIKTRDDGDFTSFLNADESTFQYKYGETEKQIIDLFFSYRDAHTYISSVYMGRENGSFVRSHPRARPTDYDPRTRPWYTAAKENPGSVVITAPYESVTTKDINVGIVTALLDEKNAVYGVVGMDMTLPDLTRYISGIKVAHNGQMLLLDRNGAIVASQRYVPEFDPDGVPEFSDIQEQETIEGGAVVEIKAGGEDAYLFFYTSPELNWVLAFLIPAREIDRAIMGSAGQNIAILALSIVLLSIVTIFGLRKYVVAPVNIIHKGTQHIKQTGDYGHHVNVKTNDELGQTARSFNDMMDTIQLSEKTSRDSYEKLQRALEGTINALSSTTEFRDPYTAGHQRRVAKLAIEIAKRMHLSDDLIQSIAAAAILHDIGKINIPSEILSKPGELGDIEMKIVRTHPMTSYEILKQIDYPWPVHTIALQHHERLNGSGYPNGLKGKDICIESRILAVADVVEAMASHRPYRSALGIEAALAEISQNSGTLYDTEATEICLAIFTENQFSFDDVNINSE